MLRETEGDIYRPGDLHLNTADPNLTHLPLVRRSNSQSSDLVRWLFAEDAAEAKDKCARFPAQPRFPILNRPGNLGGSLV